MKPMSPAAVRAMEATWPPELVICKKIAEVIACGRPMTMRAHSGIHPIMKYPLGGFVGLCDVPETFALQVPPQMQIEIGYFHVPASFGSETRPGCQFTARVKHRSLTEMITISFEDLGKPDQVKAMTEFCGNRIVHCCTHPEDYKMRGASGMADVESEPEVRPVNTEIPTDYIRTVERKEPIETVRVDADWTAEASLQSILREWFPLATVIRKPEPDELEVVAASGGEDMGIRTTFEMPDDLGFADVYATAQSLRGEWNEKGIT